VIFFSGC